MSVHPSFEQASTMVLDLPPLQTALPMSESLGINGQLVPVDRVREQVAWYDDKLKGPEAKPQEVDAEFMSQLRDWGFDIPFRCAFEWESTGYPGNTLLGIRLSDPNAPRLGKVQLYFLAHRDPTTGERRLASDFLALEFGDARDKEPFEAVSYMIRPRGQ